MTLPCVQFLPLILPELFVSLESSVLLQPPLMNRFREDLEKHLLTLRVAMLNSLTGNFDLSHSRRATASKSHVFIWYWNHHHKSVSEWRYAESCAEWKHGEKNRGLSQMCVWLESVRNKSWILCAQNSCGLIVKTSIGRKPVRTKRIQHKIVQHTMQQLDILQKHMVLYWWYTGLIIHRIDRSPGSRIDMLHPCVLRASQDACLAMGTCLVCVGVDPQNSGSWKSVSQPSSQGNF